MIEKVFIANRGEVALRIRHHQRAAANVTLGADELDRIRDRRELRQQPGHQEIA